MKRLIIIPVLLISVLAFSQSVDQILNNYFTAIHQRNLNDVESFRMTGNIYQMGQVIPLEVLQKRPGKIRTSGTAMGMQFIQTCNGEEGWSLNPFIGQTEPVAITGRELNSLKRQADMDGMLWEPEKKGASVELMESETYNGLECPRLELTTADDQVYEFLFDPETWYCLVMRTRTDVQGRLSVVESVFSGFREVDNIVFATGVETRIDGMTALRIKFDEIELNVELDDSLFEKP